MPHRAVPEHFALVQILYTDAQVPQAHDASVHMHSASTTCSAVSHHALTVMWIATLYNVTPTIAAMMLHKLSLGTRTSRDHEQGRQRAAAHVLALRPAVVVAAGPNLARHARQRVVVLQRVLVTVLGRVVRRLRAGKASAMHLRLVRLAGAIGMRFVERAVPKWFFCRLGMRTSTRRCMRIGTCAKSNTRCPKRHACEPGYASWLLLRSLNATGSTCSQWGQASVDLVCEFHKQDNADEQASSTRPTDAGHCRHVMLCAEMLHQQAWQGSNFEPLHALTPSAMRLDHGTPQARDRTW